MEFTLRPLKLEDASAFFAEYASNAEASLFLPFPTAKDVDETIAFVTDALAEIERGERLILSIVYDVDHAMGSVDFRYTNNRCEIGFVLGPAHRNQGIAKSALRGALAFLEPRMPNITFFAYVDSENVASQRVLAACGFKRNEGHDKPTTNPKLTPNARTMWYLERPNHLVAAHKSK